MVVLEKKFKEFGQFRLNLLIKISYIPDFEKIFQSYGQNIFFGQIFKLGQLNKKSIIPWGGGVGSPPEEV